MDWTRLWLPFFVLMVLAAPVSAKGGDAISPDNNTLWAQYSNEPDCCTLWMGTLQNDPSFSGSGNYGTYAVSDELGGYVWEYPLVPKLTYNVTLDTGGTVDFTVVVVGLPGASPSVGAGQVQVTPELRAGSTVVAVGAAKEATLVPMQPVELTWNESPAIAEIGAGKNLVWTISMTGEASGVYVAHGSDHGHTNLVLPVTAVAGDVPPPTQTETESEEPAGQTSTGGQEAPSPETEVPNDEPEQEEKGSPLPFLPVLVLVAVGAALRRR